VIALDMARGYPGSTAKPGSTTIIRRVSRKTARSRRSTRPARSPAPSVSAASRCCSIHWRISTLGRTCWAAALRRTQSSSDWGSRTEVVIIGSASVRPPRSPAPSRQRSRGARRGRRSRLACSSWLLPFRRNAWRSASVISRAVTTYARPSIDSASTISRYRPSSVVPNAYSVPRLRTCPSSGSPHTSSIVACNASHYVCHRAKTLRSACVPRDASGPPSTANDRHRQQPVTRARGCSSTPPGDPGAGPVPGERVLGRVTAAVRTLFVSATPIGRSWLARAPSCSAATPARCRPSPPQTTNRPPVRPDCGVTAGLGARNTSCPSRRRVPPARVFSRSPCCCPAAIAPRRLCDREGVAWHRSVKNGDSATFIEYLSGCAGNRWCGEVGGTGRASRELALGRGRGKGRAGSAGQTALRRALFPGSRRKRRSRWSNVTVSWPPAGAWTCQEPLGGHCDPGATLLQVSAGGRADAAPGIPRGCA